MPEQIIYGLITKENPIILVIGTNESEVMKRVDESAGALFKCNFDFDFDCCAVTFTGLQLDFEPSKEHYEQVKNYVLLMMKIGNLPVCEMNLGCARIVC
ncbi:MAG: hypothetical protein AABW67_03900 [Nanoarchaeota archaeon]